MLETISDEQFETFANALYSSGIDTLRERYRGLAVPMTATDRMRAKVLEAMATRFWGQENYELAISRIEQAQSKYEEAIEPNPQNRIWRLELANCQKTASNYYELQANDLRDQAKEFIGKAREKTNLAIKNYMHILESDPSDRSTRELGIEQFVRYADLSLKLEDSWNAYRGYYTAAQEYNLLPISEFDGSALYETKTWLYSTALECLKASNRPDGEYEDTLNKQSIRAQRLATEINKRFGPETVASQRAIQALRGQIQIERPPLAKRTKSARGSLTTH